jgi:hypothetical protein
MGHAVVELDNILVFVHVVVRASAVKTLGVFLESLVAWRGSKSALDQAHVLGRCAIIGKSLINYAKLHRDGDQVKQLHLPVSTAAPECCIPARVACS